MIKMIATPAAWDRLLQSAPRFIKENDPNWNEFVNYVFKTYRQPTYSEYAILDRLFDSVKAQ